MALFGYANVPWIAKFQCMIDDASFPDAAESLGQAKAAADALETEGHIAICLDRLASPDDAHGVATQAATNWRLPVAKDLTFSHDNHLRAKVIERRMCGGHLDPAADSHKHRQQQRWRIPARVASGKLKPKNCGRCRMAVYE